VKKRIVVSVALSVLFALASTDAEPADLVELAKTATPLSMQAAISKGANVNAKAPTL